MNSEGRAAVKLMEAVTEYLQSLQEGRVEGQQELLKFARWFGRERALASFKPPEIGDYAEQATAGSSNGEGRLRPVREFLIYARKRGLLEQNLAVHLKARRTGRGTRKSGPGRRAEAETVRLTAEGLAEIEERLKRLRKELTQAAAEIRRAAADKDVRENAPLEAARQHHGQIMSRIQELEDTLTRAQVLEDGQSQEARKQVRQGSTVTLRDVASGEELTYLLVDPREANSLGGKLSIGSPVGQAMHDRREGDEVEVKAPRGSFFYQILRVE